jgi:hypothetical protein
MHRLPYSGACTVHLALGSACLHPGMLLSGHADHGGLICFVRPAGCEQQYYRRDEQ